MYNLRIGMASKFHEVILLALSDPQRPLDRSLLSTQGAFLWWYLDLVSELGQGLTLIWSWGLPFLGRRTSRPSINLALYSNCTCQMYLLEELNEAVWGDGVWTFGRTRIVETVQDGERRLHVDVDLDVPGSSIPLTGHIDARDPLLRGEDEPGDHKWTPLMGLGTGSAALRFGDWSVALDGEAYRDRNEGRVPLDSMGIERWSWGRVSVGGQLFIWYDVDAERRLYRVEDRLVPIDSAVEELDPRRDLYGVVWHGRLRFVELGLEVEQLPPVDRGPFYLRLPVRATLDGETGVGWSEVVLPRKLHRPLHQPFVDMRVRRPSGNSAFLPLFSGPRQGRLRRLVGA